MKQLLLLLCATVALFSTSCDVKKTSSTRMNFTVESDCGTKENLAKIENLLKSKDLPVGENINISADGEGLESLEERAKQIMAEFLQKVSAEELKALNTGATYVLYESSLYGTSIALARARKTF